MAIQVKKIIFCLCNFLLLQNTIPFKRILVHGMAVDDLGKKMSKSKGNVVDPKTVNKSINFNKYLFFRSLMATTRHRLGWTRFAFGAHG